MQKPMKNFKYVAPLLLPLLLSQHANGANRDILWSKVNQQCVPNYLVGDIYRPCSLVNIDSRYVVYKVDNDKYQYLLLPTDKISGIEDEQLLSDKARKYFYLAWQSRSFLTGKLNKTIKEDNISLTINAENARSQDQLHIHISCLSKAARIALNGLDIDRLGNEWSPLQEKINQHSYYVKKIYLSDLKESNIFQIIRDKVTSEGGQMAYTGAALVNVDKDTFLLLESSGTAEQGVSAEEMQDHQCRIAD
jgi:CDP-diacylglycerol pyrophosphatase